MITSMLHLIPIPLIAMFLFMSNGTPEPKITRQMTPQESDRLFPDEAACKGYLGDFVGTIDPLKSVIGYPRIATKCLIVPPVCDSPEEFRGRKENPPFLLLHLRSDELKMGLHNRAQKAGQKTQG